MTKDFCSRTRTRTRTSAARTRTASSRTRTRTAFWSLRTRTNITDATTHMEAREMWIWRKMENVSWKDYVSNEKVSFYRVGEEWHLINTIKERQQFGLVMCCTEINS